METELEESKEECKRLLESQEEYLVLNFNFNFIKVFNDKMILIVFLYNMN